MYTAMYAYVRIDYNYVPESSYHSVVLLIIHYFPFFGIENTSINFIAECNGSPYNSNTYSHLL